MRVLVIGQSVRNIAISAFKAGHTVVAADCYNDLDLLEVVPEVYRLTSSDLSDPERLKALVERVDPEAVVLGPGVETIRLPNHHVLNNKPEKILQVSDKLWLAGWLQREGYPHPDTWLEEPPADREMILKPRVGAGGSGCRLIRGGDVPDGFIVQEFVEGIPASASVICDGSEAKTIAVNEQLSGIPWLNADGFRYCGNITPLAAKEDVKMLISDIAERVVSGLGLVGSNGVDFILGDDGPVVIEVNPRFQGSLDSVELSTGLSIFQAHLDSFNGRLPVSSKERRAAGRAIVYAKKNVKIDLDLRRRVSGIADVPAPGSLMERGQPVLSIISTGTGRGDVLRSLRAKRYALGEL